LTDDEHRKAGADCLHSDLEREAEVEQRSQNEQGQTSRKHEERAVGVELRQNWQAQTEQEQLKA
jgi:hypothetical protein